MPAVSAPRSKNLFRGLILSEIIIPPSERVTRELELESLNPPLDIQQEFGNANPLEVEIGIGKGYFLQHAALENPDHNFLGLELRRKYLNRAKERVEKRPLPNIRLVCGEAFEFLETFLPPESVHTMHVYFPDPWPKKRHHKRRLFSTHFIELTHSLLIPGGRLLIATDHRDYWDWICEVLSGQQLLVQCKQLPQPPAGADGLTNYEIKYKREGREIYRVGYQKPK